jgi:hypothetical protein
LDLINEANDVLFHPLFRKLRITSLDSGQDLLMLLHGMSRSEITLGREPPATFNMHV